MLAERKYGGTACFVTATKLCKNYLPLNRAILSQAALCCAGREGGRMSEQKDKSPQVPMSNDASLELPQKRWFCMSIDKSGKTLRQDAESPNSFLETICRSSVAWVDYMTDDPMKDLPVVAAQMGFSEAFVFSLSSRDQLNYQDLDTEMWMRLPSVQIRGTEVTAYPLMVLMKNNVVFYSSRAFGG